MIIKSDQARGACDACDRVGHPATHGVIQQGATGRYCEVMWICRECAIAWSGGEHNIMTAQEGRDECNADENGWADF